MPKTAFKQLLLEGTRFIDVRAEVESLAGTIPGAVNRPILNTAEREQVGRCYKQRGPEQAVALGHRLVGGAVRRDRVDAWLEFARRHPGTHVFCWRGGMRSALAVQWLAEAGVELPLIEGGYKALRGYLMGVTSDAARHAPLLVIGGKTGAAKTPLINALTTGVDLEAHANHRGSSFGRRALAPPCQIDFEHSLALDLLRTRHAHPGRPLFLEDESRRIGSVSIPLELVRAMAQAPLAIVDMSLESRIQRIVQEYVVELLAEYEVVEGDTGFDSYRRHLLDSLERISKRLGMERYTALRSLMAAALDAQQRGHVEQHEAWIQELLTDYYDPMYDYQLAQVGSRVVFRGDYETVLEWCRSRAEGEFTGEPSPHP